MADELKFIKARNAFRRLAAQLIEDGCDEQSIAEAMLSHYCERQSFRGWDFEDLQCDLELYWSAALELQTVDGDAYNDYIEYSMTVGQYQAYLSECEDIKRGVMTIQSTAPISERVLRKAMKKAGLL
jgi:hypothetical protein